MSILALLLLVLVASESGRSHLTDVPFEPFLSSSSGNDWENWGYVDVRPQAHMFYWLNKKIPLADYKERPLIIWLQGGPGASSCGFGNFEIIGPRDSRLAPRNTTWVRQANVLFIDNPVGSGFSYVDSLDRLTTNVQEITDDLLAVLKVFLKNFPEFRKTPLYVFGESYGGKMAAHFTRVLYEKVKTGEIACNLTGYAMGNSWISPIDSTMTWGPFIHWMSTTDEIGLRDIQKAAAKCKKAVNEGRWQEATELWRATQYEVDEHTNGVDFYNILRFNTPTSWLRNGDFSNAIPELFRANNKEDDRLAELMNGPIKKKLKIIPHNVTWGGQSNSVFKYQEKDFMKPVVSVVDETLKNTTLKVIVYQGQLDIICDTKGAMDWVQQFTWKGLEGFTKAYRRPLLDPVSGQTESYVKAHGNFKFYWVLRAGHMVPADAGEAASRMLERILSDLDK